MQCKRTQRYLNAYIWYVCERMCEIFKLRKLSTRIWVSTPEMVIHLPPFKNQLKLIERQRLPTAYLPINFLFSNKIFSKFANFCRHWPKPRLWLPSPPVSLPIHSTSRSQTSWSYFPPFNLAGWTKNDRTPIDILEKSNIKSHKIQQHLQS